MIRQFQILTITTLLACGIIQMVVDSSASQIQCVMIVWTGCFLVGSISFTRKAFENFPISTLQVVTFTISNLAVPLIGTTLDRHSVTQNLREPVAAFGYSALTALTLALTHLVYRHMKLVNHARDVVSQKFVAWTGIFAPPAPYQLWGIGAVGCVAMMAEAFLFNKDTLDVRGVVQQLVHGFTSFSYAPFLIPVAHLFWPAEKPSSSAWTAFGVYFALVAVLSMALNARGAFAVPLVTMLGAVVLAMLMGRLKINLFSWKMVLTVVVALAVIAPQLADLSTAMRIARGQKKQLSKLEMIEKSVGYFFDKDKLDTFRKGYQLGNLRAGEYEERYLNNEFLARFTFLKYTDNSLYYTKYFGDLDRERLADFGRDRLLGQVPGPVLRILGINYNKWKTLVMSFGDFVYYARTGFDYAGFRTGSFIGNGIAVHGWRFFLVFASVAFLVSFVADIFCLRMRKRGAAAGSSDLIVRISPMVLMFLFPFAFYFNNEDVVTYIAGMVRTIPQMAFLYLLLFHCSRTLSVFVPTPSPLSTGRKHLA